MQTSNIEGITLSSIDYKEKSKIVYIYTKYGKISYKALGSLNQKKGMLPLITTMNQLNVILTQSKFPTAIDYTLLNSYDDIKNDLKKSLWFSYILEIISKLPEDAPHERIYNLLKRLLEIANKCDGLMIGVVFLIKMTYSFGVAPELRKCVICQNSNISYFSIKDGGALCKDHFKHDSYEKEVLDEIKNIYYFNIYDDDLDKIKNYDYKLLFDIMNKYYNEFVHIYLKGLNSLIF